MLTPSRRPQTLAVLAEARLDAGAAAGAPRGRVRDGARVALLADVAGRVRAELADALEKRSSFQESRMTGVSRSATSRRMARQSEKPSRFGIRMSLMTRSGDDSYASSSAFAIEGLEDAARRLEEVGENQTTAGSSSATTTRRPSRRTSAAARPLLAAGGGRAVRARRLVESSAGVMAPSGPPAKRDRAVGARGDDLAQRSRPTSRRSTSVPSPKCDACAAVGAADDGLAHLVGGRSASSSRSARR